MAGKHRPTLQNLGVYLRSYQAKLPLWIAVSGMPAAVGCAATLAIISGMSEHFAPFIDLYWKAAQQVSHDPAQLPVSINSHSF